MKKSILLCIILAAVITIQTPIYGKTIYNLETDSFDNKQRLTKLNDWMKTDYIGNGVTKGRGIPGMWNYAFSKIPVEGKIYVSSKSGSKYIKTVSVNNKIDTAFYDDSESQMLILPPGSSRPDQVIEKSDEYALYTPGGEMTNKVTGINKDGSAELTLEATTGGVFLELTRLLDNNDLPENNSLDTNFTFKGVKSALDISLGLYLNHNTGGGSYSSMPKAYYYATTDTTVDMSNYIAPNKTSLYLKQDNVNILVDDVWDSSLYFKSATDKDGNSLSYNQLTNIKDQVDTSKPGTYQVFYQNGISSEEGSVERILNVNVLPKLTLIVPTSNDFGSYKLGSARPILPWNHNNSIWVENNSNDGWNLTASLSGVTDGLENYIMNSGRLLKDNNLIAHSVSTGKINISDDWSVNKGLYIDYSNAKELRKDKAVLSWSLTPSTKGISE